MNISHELKTPLGLIIAPLSKLISETKNQEKQTKTGAYSSEFIAFEHSDTTGAEFQADGV